jgi:hypothetical protein
MEPQSSSPLNPDPSQQTMSPATLKTPNKRKMVAICVVALIAAVTAGVTAFYLFYDNASNNATTRTETNTTSAPEPKAMAEQVLTNPADNSKIAIGQMDYYRLAVGSATYYGPILKINDTYLRMVPTAYKNQGELIFTGNELHGPESATFFTIPSISNVRKLEASSSDDMAIIDFVKAQVSQSSYAYPSDKIDSYLETSRLQAFFFKDGMTLFAKASTLQGSFLAGANHVYYMANTNGQVSLTVAKPNQYANRTGRELLYWQNLRSNGKVAKAITDFEKNNP